MDTAALIAQFDRPVPRDTLYPAEPYFAADAGPVETVTGRTKRPVQRTRRPGCVWT